MYNYRNHMDFCKLFFLIFSMIYFDEVSKICLLVHTGLNIHWFISWSSSSIDCNHDCHHPSFEQHAYIYYAWRHGIRIFYIMSWKYLLFIGRIINRDAYYFCCLLMSFILTSRTGAKAYALFSGFPKLCSGKGL